MINDDQVKNIENAITSYIQHEKIIPPFSNLAEILSVLAQLPETKWQQLRPLITSLKPKAYSFKYTILQHELPAITKRSLALSILVMMSIYYHNRNILHAVSAGVTSASVAWIMLAEVAYSREQAHRSYIEQRVNIVLQHDRFFNWQPKVISSSQHKELANINAELEGNVRRKT
jgi:hypothetical protein